MSTKKTRKVVKTYIERRQNISGCKIVQELVYSCDKCNKGYWTLAELKSHYESGCAESDMVNKGRDNCSKQRPDYSQKNTLSVAWILCS